LKSKASSSTVANIQSAKKRARQGERRRIHNIAMKSRMRTRMKAVLKAVQSGDKAAANAEFKAAVPAIDKAVTKGLIQKNRAAKYKSRLNARVKAMS
jgi:small subunit ribosomal protein S20